MGFTKMHGCGNDYIYVNGAEAAIDERKKEGIVRKLSDRHFGIGGDGVIFIHSLSGEDAIADFEMEMYNADGSRAEMCGNGIRCVAKYVYDKGLTDKGKIRIASCGKVKYLDLAIKEGKVANVRVNMGAPILAAEDIPVISGQKEAIAERIEVEGKDYEMTCVSMGNPHAVVFMKAWEDLDSFALEKIGPYFENHMRFPKRTNTEFVKVIDRNTVQMRVWERGTGETLACGTGACATVVACVLNGLTEEEVTVKLLGGELKVQWDRENNTVYMAGPAETVFDGMIEIDGMD
ncbi:MAG: diaminopimelate epimerase [Lachnospiraceae bacterium]|nr:diaminopimelate epimerase [Lachnospiraceae bacterium]